MSFGPPPGEWFKRSTISRLSHNYHVAPEVGTSALTVGHSAPDRTESTNRQSDPGAPHYRGID